MRGLYRRGVELVAVAAMTASSAACSNADQTERVGSRGPSCCSLFITALFVAVFRSGQVPWGLAIGAAILPGIFGWFVWKDRDYGLGARILALVLAIFQALGIVLVIVAALVLPTMIRHMAASVTGGEPPPAALAKGPLTPEAADSLGLTPWGTVESTPPGAKVSIDGTERGVTPLRTRFTAARKNAVHLQLDGYFSEDRMVEPNTSEEVKLSLLLRHASHLHVTSTPPGARVLSGDQVVLAATPGVTGPLEPGAVDLTVMLEGYQPLRHARDVPPGDTDVEVTLVPGVKVSVVSEPPGAEVHLDEAYVGHTPLEMYVAKKGKHALAVTKEPLTPVKRTLANVKGGETLKVQLVDAELVAVQKKLAKARAEYEAADARLNALQRKLEHLDSPSRAAEAQLAAAEKVMEKASTKLEAAETELREAEEARGIAPTPVVPREPKEAP